MNKFNRLLNIGSFFYMFSVLLLAACGGGGGSTDSSPTITDNYSVSLSYPTASANLGGVEQTTIAGKLERTDGAAVADTDINFVSVNNVIATMDSSDASRWSVQVPVTVNAKTNLNITVEYSDGSTDSLSHQLTNSLQFSKVSNLTLDEDNNRVLALDLVQQALGAVDLTSGERSIISGSGKGTTLEVGADIFIPIAVAIDAINNRALVIQNGSDMILSIDLTSGDRSFFSRAGDFAKPVSLIVDSENERALVVDSDLNAIISIHLNTGVRNIVSGSIGGGLFLGDGPTFVDPIAIAFLERGFVMVMDANVPGLGMAGAPVVPETPLFEVNLTTGERRIISDNNTTGSAGPVFESPQAVGLESSGKVLVFNNGNDSLYAVDVAGNRTIVSGPDATLPIITFGFAVDISHQRVLLPNFSSNGLIAIDLNTGMRSNFSKSNTGAGVALSDPEKITLDSDNNRAFILEGDGVTVVDLSTGDRTVFSNGTTGTGIAFLSPSDMVLDSDNNRVLILDDARLAAVDLDTGNRTVFDVAHLVTGIVMDSVNNRVLLVSSGALHAVDLTSAERIVISDSVTGSGPDISPLGIAMDSANNRALILNTFTVPGLPPTIEFGVLAVNLNTGERSTLVGGGFTTSGLSDPQSIAVDRVNNRALIVDDAAGFPSIKAVDLTSGDLSVLSDVITGNGPVFADPKGIVVDNENYRALVMDSALKTLLVVDLTTGDRAITTQ